MLTGITLENFKAFKEPQFIPIKPITLVFGPNSAGKSSIMHALAFLKHVDATKGHCDPDSVEFGWEKIKLGSWQNLVHGHDASAVMKITLHWENKELKCEKALTWAFRKHPDGPPYVESFEIAENGIPVARGKNQRTKGILWSVELHSKHPLWKEFKDKVWDLILATDPDPGNEYVPLDTGDLGIVDVRGERLQVYDSNVEAFINRNKKRELQLSNKKALSEEVFEYYFSSWLGDEWREIPKESSSANDAMIGLFPGIGKSSRKQKEHFESTFGLALDFLEESSFYEDNEDVPF